MCLSKKSVEELPSLHHALIVAVYAYSATLVCTSSCNKCPFSVQQKLSAGDGRRSQCKNYWSCSRISVCAAVCACVTVCACTDYAQQSSHFTLLNFKQTEGVRLQVAKPVIFCSTQCSAMEPSSTCRLTPDMSLHPRPYNIIGSVVIATSD